MFLTRENERDRLVISVDQEKKRIVANRLILKIEHIAGVAAQQYAKTTYEGRRPFFLAHFVPAGIEPHHIPNLRAANPAALEEFRPAKHGMLFAELNQSPRKFQKLILFLIAAPIEPTNLVILAISVVVQ